MYSMFNPNFAPSHNQSLRSLIGIAASLIIGFIYKKMDLDLRVILY